MGADSVDDKDRGTRHRLGAAPRVAERKAASDDDVRAAQIAKLVGRYRGDVAQQIELAGILQREFELNAWSYPHTRRAAATELLHIYGKLKLLEKKAKTDRSGRLLTSTALDPKPKLWTRKGPHNVEEIEPFNAAHVIQWKAVGDTLEPKRYLPPPLGVPKPKLAPLPKAESAIEYTTIKIPGMTLSTAEGRGRILAAVIRLASKQTVTEPVARKIAATMNLWTYLVLDFGDTTEHATKSYDSLSLGWSYRVKLRREFLGDLQKLTAASLTSTPLYWSRSDGDFREYMPDFSAEERSWYVIGRLANKPAKDRRSGFTPGQFVTADGVIFVGPELNESLFYTPDGRLFGVPEKSVREQQLDAIIQGTQWARGGVILGYGIVVVGAVALVAPALVAAAAEALAGAIALSGEVTTVYESIIYSRYFIWVSRNIMFLRAVAVGGTTLGIKLYYFSPRAFVEEFKRDPTGALVNAGYSIAETLHDFGDALSLRPTGGVGTDPGPSFPASPARQRALPVNGIPDEPPGVVIPRVAPTPTAAPTPLPAPTPTPIQRPAPVAPAVDVHDSDELAGQRMTRNPLARFSSAATDYQDNDLQAVPQALAKNENLVMAQQRTGTDDVSVPVGTPAAPGGVIYRPSATRPPVSPDLKFARSVDAARGRVRTAANATNRSPVPPPRPPTPASKPAAVANSEDDDHRGTLKPMPGLGPIIVRPKQQWTPTTTPRRPVYANKTASVAERIRFIEEQDTLLKKSGQGLGPGQRAKLDALKAKIDSEGLTDKQVLNINAKPKAAKAPDAVNDPESEADAQPGKKPKRPPDPLRSYEETINAALRQDFMQRIEVATGLRVVGVANSNNVGDQAADDYARSQGRPYALSFTTTTPGGGQVEIDDFDVTIGQPIEHKSIQNLVPPHLVGQVRDYEINKYVQQVTKQAVVARHYRTEPIKWVVPVDLEDTFVADVMSKLPASLRKYIQVARGEGYF